MQLQEVLSDFFSMIFPNCCAGCGNSLMKNEPIVCTRCLLNLPITNSHKGEFPELERKFWGKVDLRYVFAYLRYTKHGFVQNLIHSLKYKGVEEIGELFGKWYGAELSRADLDGSFDVIVPVPLHPNKLRQRGYNQCDSFARGLSSMLEVPWYGDVLQRLNSNASQTRKNRMGRWENVKDLFALKREEIVAGKNILLVDDVITTGSTIEASTYPLLNGGAASVSVAAICTA